MATHFKSGSVLQEKVVLVKYTKNNLLKPTVYGVIFTCIIALLGYGLAMVPGFNHIGQLACSIIIAVAFRQILGYPESIRPGIQFSAKKLLRFAIILYGLKLNMDVVFHQGLGLIVHGAGTIVFSILATMFLAKWLKADLSLSLLLGVGTGVCGAAAIAAVSPILKAKDEDTAISVGIVAMIGTIFAVGYTLIRPLLHLTNMQYGIWSGVSLHEIAQVALAAAPAGQDALAISLLAKLGRVFLLIPLSFILMFWMRKSGRVQTRSTIEIPWFLLGFILMSFFGSYIIGHAILIPKSALDTVTSFTTFVLTMAMVGLGLNVNIKDLRTRALRPLIAMTITSIVLSIITYFTLG